jgi:hypothetical protein
MAGTAPRLRFRWVGAILAPPECYPGLANVVSSLLRRNAVGECALEITVTCDGFRAAQLFNTNDTAITDFRIGA